MQHELRKQSIVGAGLVFYSNQMAALFLLDPYRNVSNQVETHNICDDHFEIEISNFGLIWTTILGLLVQTKRFHKEFKRFIIPILNQNLKD